MYLILPVYTGRNNMQDTEKNQQPEAKRRRFTRLSLELADVLVTTEKYFFL